MTDNTHKRDAHARRKQDGDMTSVRAAIVPNRGRKHTLNDPAPPSKGALIGLADINDEEEFDADIIIFAFEHSEWTSVGFDRKTAEPWMNLNFPPEEAKTWKDAGYEAQFANQWRLANRTKDLFPAQEALLYIDNNIPLEKAQGYGQRNIPAHEAIQWHPLNLPTHEILGWRNLEVTPDRVQEHFALGLGDPFEVSRIKIIGQPNAHKYMEAGIPISEAGLYHQLTKQGKTVERIVAAISTRATNSQRKEWILSELPDNQMVEFAQKGYTVRRATQLYQKGITSSKAPDLHNGEPVPGKSWKDIKSAIEKEAQNKNYDIEVETKDISVYRSVKVKLTNKTDPSDTKTFRLRFSQSGAFKEANSNIKRRTRIVKTKAEFLRLHFSE
jgi:hypothetical protein